MMTALTGLSVIDMKPCHAERVAELEKISFSSPWSVSALLDSLEKSYSLFLVAQNEDKLLGYVGSYCLGGECAITNVAVFPEHKKTGVGTSLICELISRAKEQGLEQISLEVRTQNTPAVKFYEKLGFVTVGTRPSFYTDPRDDAYVMIYKLL